MIAQLLEFFTDPVLRGPALGSLFMGAACGLIGTFTFLQKKSLISETLSHAVFPGAMLAMLLGGAVFHLTDQDELSLTLLIAFFSILSASIVMRAIKALRKYPLPLDTIFCFLIASSFGFGVTLASWLQFRFSSLYKSAESYLFGQTATMTDIHIYLFASFFVCAGLFVVLFYKQIQAHLFDHAFSSLIGIQNQRIGRAIQFFLIGALILGMRATGALLMSALLIAPPIAARQLTKRLDTLFFLSSFLGGLSGFLGTVLAHLYESKPPLPSGPTIVLTAASFAFLALLFPTTLPLKRK